ADSPPRARGRPCAGCRSLPTAPSSRRRGTRLVSPQAPLALALQAGDFEERVRQRDRMHVLRQLRIDDEGDRHAPGLPCRERLRLVAETFELAQIAPRMRWPIA